MGFFKDLSQDVSQAIGELIPDQLMEDDMMVDTLNETVADEAVAEADTKKKDKKKKKKAKEEADTPDVIADLVAQEEQATKEVNEQLQKEIMNYLENGGLDDVVVDTLEEDAFDAVITDETVVEEAPATEETLDDEDVPAIEDLTLMDEVLAAQYSAEEEIGMDINEKEEIESIIESLGELAPEEMGVLEELEEKSIEEKLLDDDIDVAPVTPNRVASQEVSIITKGTSVEGSINASGALEIYGKVNGDVECLGKLTILGDVTGNAKANEIFINTSRFEGDVNSAGAVKIGVGTVVIGDVTGTGAVIAGAVKGEVDISGPVILDSTAVVKGNIKAKSVQINNGAVLQGFCSLAYSTVDIDDFFDTEEFR